jgi:hypothetical protein
MEGQLLWLPQARRKHQATECRALRLTKPEEGETEAREGGPTQGHPVLEAQRLCS